MNIEGFTIVSARFWCPAGAAARTRVRDFWPSGATASTRVRDFWSSGAVLNRRTRVRYFWPSGAAASTRVRDFWGPGAAREPPDAAGRPQVLYPRAEHIGKLHQGALRKAEARALQAPAPGVLSQNGLRQNGSGGCARKRRICEKCNTLHAKTCFSNHSLMVGPRFE